MARGRAWWVLVCGVALVGCREHGTNPIDQPDAGWVDPPVSWRVARPNPIPTENANPGEPAWRAGRQASGGAVEVYASTDSATSGQVIAVRVSVSRASRVSAEVFRIGWYGGAGARRMWTGGPYDVTQQPACPMDRSTGRVECHWADAFSFPVGTDWVSGLYVVKVTRADGYRSFAPFVVRDDRAAELLYASALNTSQAYNGYGGESLYQDNSGTMPKGHAREVSYERPFAADDGLGKVFHWEAYLARFMEQYGYNVTYATNLDFARVANLPTDIGAVITGAHDEYWLREERDQVDRMLAGPGPSLAFFGADGSYWRVRAGPSGTGAPLRTIACYKNEPTLDPVPYSTIRFRDSPDPLPESLLYGVMYDGWQLVSFPLVVSDPSHWLFDGTGVRAGDRFTGLVGYEYDRVFDPSITPPDLSIPLTSPVVSAEGIPSASQAAVRTTPFGRLVFGAGTIYWAEGLGDDPDLRDGRVQRMTLNVLERALAHRRPMRQLPDLSGNRPPAPQLDPIWALNVTALAGVPDVAGAQDGPVASATFDGPTGLAAGPHGEIAVADAAGNRVRLIDAARQTVTTIAGTGELGLRDGPAATSQLRRPTSVAFASDGAILVADSDNHCIRRIAPDPSAGWVVSTYAGGARAQGTADGPALSARFNRPTAIATDGAGNLYVADQANNRIRRVDVATRMVTTVAGGAIGSADAPIGLNAQFNNPSAIAVSPAGEIYVLDAGNQRVRRIGASAAREVTTIAGDPGYAFGLRDGVGSQALFRAQMGLAMNAAGQLLLADTANFRIRKIIPGATADDTRVYTIAGSGQSGTQLGTGATSDLPAPAGIAVLPGDILVVSDSFHHLLRMVSR